MSNDSKKTIANQVKNKHSTTKEKVNVQKKKAYVNKNEESHNTTPSLTVKALTSHGATREMGVVGRTTPDARVKVSEKRGDVSSGGNQWGRNWSGSAYHGGGCTRNGDDNGSIIVERVRKANSGGELSSFNDSSGRSRGDWCWYLNLLSSNVVDDSSRGRNLRLSSCLN